MALYLVKIFFRQVSSSMVLRHVQMENDVIVALIESWGTNMVQNIAIFSKNIYGKDQDKERIKNNKKGQAAGTSWNLVQKRPAGQ